MKTIKFTCDVIVSDPSKVLNFEVKHNGNSIFEVQTTQDIYKIEHDIQDIDNGTQTIEFIMSGKTDSHTEVDHKTSEILSTSQLEVNNICVDGLDISNTVHEHELMEYVHNTNGYTDTKKEVFDFYMGCNGIATFKFKTPFYVWLLDYV